MIDMEISSPLTLALAQCKPVAPDPPNILRSLLTVQDAVGYVPTDAVGYIARALQVTEADVAGVLSYYPDLHRRPMGRHLIRVCMGESCVANDSPRVMRTFQECLRIQLGETTQDDRFSLEKVYCVGNCAVSPTVMIDGDVHGRVTPSQVETILENYK